MDAATYGGLVGVFTLFGILVRAYLKSDDRWGRILDAQNEEHAQVTADRDYWRARAVASQNDADRWRARYFACAAGQPDPHPDPPPTGGP